VDHLGNFTMAEIRTRSIPDNIQLNDYPVWLANIFASRGISSNEQLDYSLKHLPNPSLMKGATQAAGLLADAIEQQQRLLIIADYDVDGATSCTLMQLILKEFSAKHVSYLVPDRFKLGYGLSPAIVDLAMDENPDWLITVDNGIASEAGVRRAKELGIGIIITDHHLPGETLPDADAIVNPNQPGCEFPSKALAGVGVAFYTLLALRAELRQRDWFAKQGIAEPNLGNYLDLVALGSVADLVPLDHLNRCLIQQGLERINQKTCRPAITTLLSFVQREFSRIQAQDLGFIVAPRLNAAGRLDDMRIGIECLMSQTQQGAEPLAEELNHWNLQRRAIQEEMQQQALDIVRQQKLDKMSDKKAVCLYSEKWHEGVIGLIASKIKDQLYRPTIVFARSDETGLIKGSARSIKGIHIRDVLDRIATQKPEMLQKFGGHAMAAGLTIEEKYLAEFETTFNEVVKNWSDDGVFDNILWSDGELSPAQLNLENAELLEQSGPWGQKFPEPQFDGKFKVIDWKILKQRHIKFRLSLGDSGIVDAIAFNQSDDMLYRQFDHVHLLYRLSINRFRGVSKLQLMIDYISPP